MIIDTNMPEPVAPDTVSAATPMKSDFKRSAFRTNTDVPFIATPEQCELLASIPDQDEASFFAAADELGIDLGGIDTFAELDQQLKVKIENVNGILQLLQENPSHFDAVGGADKIREMIESNLAGWSLLERRIPG